MKRQKITIDNSLVVDLNFNDTETTQIRVIPIDDFQEQGLGVAVKLSSDEIIYISQEFIDYFHERLKEKSPLNDN